MELVSENGRELRPYELLSVEAIKWDPNMGDNGSSVYIRCNVLIDQDWEIPYWVNYVTQDADGTWQGFNLYPDFNYRRGKWQYDAYRSFRVQLSAILGKTPPIEKYPASSLIFNPIINKRGED